MQNYVELCQVTKSDQFHGELVPLGVLMRTLRELITQGNILDKVKKTLFYGRANDYAVVGNTSCKRIADGWRHRDGRTIAPQAAMHLIHCMIGVQNEATEIMEQLLIALETGSFDEAHFLEEIGDSQWYQAVGVDALGYKDFGTVQRMNIAKLQERYAGKFSEHAANVRDLGAERQTLEQGIPERIINPKPHKPV